MSGGSKDAKKKATAGTLWRFNLRSRERTLQMAAPDKATLERWVESLKTAIYAAETLAVGSRFQFAPDQIQGSTTGGATLHGRTASGAMPLGVYHVRAGHATDAPDAGISTQHLGVAYQF